MSLAVQAGLAVAAIQKSNVTKWEAGTCLHVATASRPNSHWAIGTETLEVPGSTTGFLKRRVSVFHPRPAGLTDAGGAQRGERSEPIGSRLATLALRGASRAS